MSEQNDAREAAKRKLSQRMRMLEQSMGFLNAAAIGGRKALNSSLKGAMPLFEAYSGKSARNLEKESKDAEAPRILDLNLGQSLVVKAAGTKLFHEMMEIASVTHPIYDGAPAYQMSVDGQMQTPHLLHFMALGAAASDLFGQEETKPERPEKPQEPEFPQTENAVAYLTVAPGEYEVATGPQSLTEIRRSGMRERSYNPPAKAMMASNNQPLVYSGTEATAFGHNSKVIPFSSRRLVASEAMVDARPAKQKFSGGCGCGAAKGCSCGCGRGACDGTSGKCGHHPFGEARYEDDGSCAPTGKISCETQWRLRDCVKYAFCDMLRCMSEEMCDENCRLKEEANIGDCVEIFLCSLINCLPEAICPPKKPEKCCDPGHLSGCGCNYAVGSNSDEY